MSLSDRFKAALGFSDSLGYRKDCKRCLGTARIVRLGNITAPWTANWHKLGLKLAEESIVPFPLHRLLAIEKCECQDG